MREPDKDSELKLKILEIREKNPNYGLRRIHAVLKMDEEINIKKVHRLYKELGMQIKNKKSRKPYTFLGSLKDIPNRIKRRFDSTMPNLKLFTDTTYVKIYKDKENYTWAYLNAFIDGFDRKIISYNIVDNMKKEPFIDLAKETIRKTNNAEYRRTFHSDQGIIYFSKEYQDLLKENNIYQSMSRRGNCLDNSVIESFWSVIKREKLSKTKFKSLDQLQKAVDEFVEYYNNTRIKEKNNYLSPNEKRAKYYEEKERA